jgi:RNA 2',3'-cyclic 3'-phosphodiesterase
MNLRCFIAVGIPGPIKKGIGELIDILKKHDSDVKWIMPENLHLTLKFLGSTAEDSLPVIEERLAAVTASQNQFYIKIHGAGVFPNKKHPRVIWVGMEDSEALVKLQNEIDETMHLSGHKKDDREFRPHLTIGRVRAQEGLLNIINELDNFKDKDFGSFAVDGIKLMKSELKPGGAEYTCLKDLRFPGANAA